MRRLLSNYGSAENLRVSLTYWQPEEINDLVKISGDIKHIEDSIEDEKRNLSRTTVLRMLNSKLKKYIKRKEKLQGELRDILEKG